MRLRYLFIPLAVVGAGLTAMPGLASAAPTKVGIESFISTQNINATGGPVTASGVINGHGRDIVVSATEDTFVFGNKGQITVFHSAVKSTQHVNPKQCTFSFTEKGNYVFGNGTGEWANYNGSGKYTVNGSAIDACTGPGIGSVTITATGGINNSSTDS
jgi:hypothetical protein